LLRALRFLGVSDDELLRQFLALVGGAGEVAAFHALAARVDLPVNAVVAAVWRRLHVPD
jgi:hypothetical protein